METAQRPQMILTPTFTLPSPGKVNHFLHITGRRTDGYHLLQTLFQFIDYGDQIHFELREDAQIKLVPADISGIPLETNLIYRAARALQQAAQVTKGVTLYIEKQLPLGGGLGGGSSNAATTLVGLNHLWGLGWSSSQLQALGLTLGADVPIFIFSQAAFAEGLGEQFTPVTMKESWLVVITPACQISTSKMFASPDLTRNSLAFKIGTLNTNEVSLLLNGSRNDFEPLVRQHYPEVDDAMKWLSDFGKAQLSGSGSSVFACFDSKEQAVKITQRLPQRFKGFVAKGMNKSPLATAGEKLLL